MVSTQNQSRWFQPKAQNKVFLKKQAKNKQVTIKATV